MMSTGMSVVVGTFQCLYPGGVFTFTHVYMYNYDYVCIYLSHVEKRKRTGLSLMVVGGYILREYLLCEQQAAQGLKVHGPGSRKR